MKTSAIICEYNPFHNGHKFQIDTARSITNCDAVIALMSGNFVQRGDFALFPKEIRAKAALSGGADLILENPTFCVLRSAEGYASAAVCTLTSLGCVDSLVFGAECDDIKLLTSIANILVSEDKSFCDILSCELSKGASYPTARGIAVGKILGSDAEEILKQPNNILAVEYIKAIIKQNSSLSPVVIQRKGAGHNSSEVSENIASASFIRDEFTQNKSSSLSFVPDYAAELYSKSSFFKVSSADNAIIASLNLKSALEIASAPDISEGLEYKIKKEAALQNSLEALTDSVKSKRYAYSRIRRAILCSSLGITVEDAAPAPQYIKILDFNETGRAVLNTAKKSCTLPLAKNASAILKDEKSMAIWRRELEFDRIYDIFVQNI